jgi:hypothetical protein
LPHEAILDNVVVPGDMRPGLYDLKNATLFSNGTLQVIATEDTLFELYNYRRHIPF